MKRSIAMKRGLIALAVAGAFAAPAAMAEVTISGAINIGIDASRSNDGSTPGSAQSRTSLHPSYSHLDIGSTDDIGNGNKVIFNYQFDISGTSSAAPTNAGGAIGNRNSYLGFAGGWGTFKVGTNENVYERLQYQSDPLDGAVGPGGNLNILGTPGAFTVFEVGQNPCLGIESKGSTGIDSKPSKGCVGFYRRAEQEIWYESPNWNGITFEVDKTLSAFKTKTAIVNVDPEILSVGAKWQPEGMPFYVDVGYEDHKDMFGIAKLSATSTSGTNSKDDAWEIGAGWTLGDLALHARFETLKYKLDNSNGISEYKRNAWWIAAKYNLPSGYVGAEIGIAKDGTCTDAVAGTCVADKLDRETGATMFGAGYFHNLSKQSQLQFIYARTSNKDNGTYAQIDAAGGSAGSDFDVVSVRLKHTF